jgi:hypothetical protein
VIEGRPADTEGFGGRVPIPVKGNECLEDELAFGAFQGLAERADWGTAGIRDG